MRPSYTNIRFGIPTQSIFSTEQHHHIEVFSLLHRIFKVFAFHPVRPISIHHRRRDAIGQAKSGSSNLVGYIR